MRLKGEIETVWKIRNEWLDIYNGCDNGREGFEKLSSVKKGLESFRATVLNDLEDSIRFALNEPEIEVGRIVEIVKDIPFVVFNLATLNSLPVSSTIIGIANVNSDAEFYVIESERVLETINDVLGHFFGFDFDEAVLKRLQNALMFEMERLTAYHKAHVELTVIEYLRLSIINSGFKIPLWLSKKNIEEEVRRTIKPHQDEVDRQFSYMKEKGNMKVEPAFNELKDKLIGDGWDPAEYGLKDDPDNFNRAVNNRNTKKKKNGRSQK